MLKKFLLCILIFPFPAYSAENLTAINSVLSAMMPGRTADSIKETPVPGLYEVAFTAEVVYISADGRYMFQGDLVDLSRKENITEKAREVGRVKLLKTLDEKTMIVYPAKEEKYVVTVFTDIDCPYCRKMHEEMADYNNEGITMRYLAFPRSGPDTESYYKAVNVWCAKDPAQAMTDSKSGKAVTSDKCSHPVDDHMKLADRLGVSGTPYMIFENGGVAPGYVPPFRLKSYLSDS